MTKIRTSKKNAAIGRWIRIAALSGALVAYSASAFAVMQNNALPQGGNFAWGSGTIPDKPVNNTLNIGINNDVTAGNNALIKWDSFNIGSIATVNFNGAAGFNVVNYVNSGGSMSQIHGAMNAAGGNVYLINPAGVFIGKSASINVGSLHVSNRKIEGIEVKDYQGNKDDFDKIINGSLGKITNAELMNLGHINANHVTFEGSRIVMDMDRIAKADGSGTYEDVNITVKTTNADNVVLGYDGYDDATGKFLGAKDTNTTEKTFTVTEVNENGATVSTENAKGYMWVEDLEQLQAMESNKNGNYALHNAIDATATKHPDNGIDSKNFHFQAIGTTGDAFTGKFDGLANNIDGLDFSIFDLNIYGDEQNKGNTNLGLFGVTENADIRNLTFVNGGVEGGTENVGMVVGSATGGTISNIKTSADVTGTNNSTSIGGIVGSANGTILDKLHNTGHVQGHENVGGIVGNMNGGVLTESTNIGQVEGLDGNTFSHNVGGLVGSAENAAIGGDAKDENGNIITVGNYLTVKGGYNVGGIVGNAVNTSIKNAINTGNITATGYTTEDYKYLSNNDQNTGNDGYNIDRHEVSVKVNVSNAGGIAGTVSGKSELTDVTNDGGNVSSSTDVIKKIDDNGTEDAYIGGNIGGIVGKVQGTDSNNKVTITNATNKENVVRGAHNIGGVAGFMENASIDKGINNGGDILGTGAVYTQNGTNNFVSERVRGDVNRENFIVGNIGGIAGYMYGDDTFIRDSGNRGTVHTQDIEDPNNVLDSSKAANVGGIVGKINRSSTKTLNEIKGDASQAAVSGSYNTGDVRGYTGVGGVIGMMYNGEVTDSYNQGNIRTTRQVSPNAVNEDVRLAVNMGGVVGDTTEGSSARALIYDVYNSGVIGDKNFEFYARHVGGVVGRLSGTVEKSYNTGDIYNGYSVVGGIAGWFNNGSINNSFNTGNITTVNNDTEVTSSVGGIAGGVELGNKLWTDSNIKISNSYNLGTIRSHNNNISGKATQNSVGGIIGAVSFWGSNAQGLTNRVEVDINNVYTIGNLYAGNKLAQGGYEKDNNAGIGTIYGTLVGLKDNVPTKDNVNISAAYYITPEDDNEFDTLNADNSQHIYSIDFSKKDQASQYQQGGNQNPNDNFKFATQTDGKVENDGDWRIYDGTTPILNAFLPDWYEYNSNGITGGTIQLGTADNPLNTIITANNNNIDIDWRGIGAGRNDSFTVNNGGLSINNFTTGSNYYGGEIISSGDLSITTIGDMKLSSAGSLTSGGNLTVKAENGSIDIYGNMTAGGDVDVTGEDVESIGAITAGEDINVTVTKGNADLLYGVNESGKLTAGGDLNVTGKGANSNIYIDADMDITGSINLKADGEIVLDISNVGKYDNKNLTGDAKDTALKNAMHKFLDSFAKNDTTHNPSGSSISFAKKDGVTKNENAMITVDMWKENTNDPSKGEYDLTKYDKGNTTFVAAFNKANIKNGGTQLTDNKKEILHLWVSDAEQLKGIQANYNAHKGDKDGILGYNFALKNNIDANGLENYESIGYAEKNIDVGEGAFIGFTGTFNGRNNYIIGLKNDYTDANKENDNDYVGVFGIMSGTVKNMGIISSDLQGGSVGAVAGWNRGTIDNVNTFGNRIESMGYVVNKVGAVQSNEVGAAGGIAGINSAIIQNVNTQDAVIAGVPAGAINEGIASTAGGVVGYNTGFVQNSTANTAVTSSSGKASGLGGVVGINNSVREWNYTYTDASGKEITANGSGLLDTVESLGIVNGTYKKYKDDNTVDGTEETQNIGGIAGVNYNGGTIKNAYNEAYVYGSSAVGGIVGWNGSINSDKVSTIENAVNSGPVTGTVKNTGGLVGNMFGGKLEHAINTGVIEGVVNVGGLVGTNGAEAKITNAKNTGAATITGIQNVGGIAGENKGNINAEDSKLENYGKIFGLEYVGGIAGKNTESGSIKNTIVDMELNIVDKEYVEKVNAEIDLDDPESPFEEKFNADNPQYFGGVTGYNDEKATITNATNIGNVKAEDANYVGGITGLNRGNLQDAGNTGVVIGKNYVGGVAGKNEHNYDDITGSPEKLYNITNKGVVEALNGGAGGIFGENTGNLKYVELKNEGIVIGNEKTDPDGLAGTGGVIGVNSGTIEYSSLINTKDATVVGADDVGGLIGVNTGSVKGDRDEGGNYYKYQIYNNGKVVGGEGSYTERKDENGNVTGYDVTTNTNNDKGNVGGLIGNNSGANSHLEAGYNTGNVDGGLNRGAIAGSNSGTIDQVFSTANINNTLVGDNANGTITNSYYTDGNNQHFVGENLDDEGIWKNYDGQAEQLLKVFLTNANIEFVDGYKPVYDGKEHNFTFNYDNATKKVAINDGDKIIGYISTASTDHNAVHSFADYVNTNAEMINKLIAQKTGSEINAGKYEDFIYSNQINTNGADGSPNNLGFNFTGDVNLERDKAQLNITLDDIWRVYGNNIDIWKDSALSNKGDYNFTVNGQNITLNETMLKEIADKLGFEQKTDVVVDGFTGDKKTNNVGDYNWSADFTLDSSLVGNYEFVNGSSSTTVVGENKSHVKKAKLTLNLNEIFHQYGNVNDFFKDEGLSDKGSQYGYAATVDGLVNGDTMTDKIELDKSQVTDTAIKGDKTANVGHDYKWNINDLTGLLTGTVYDKNYEIDTDVAVNTGTSHVEKAYLNITLNDIFRQYGNVTDFFKDHNLSDKDQGKNYGYKVMLGGFVNGDEVNPENIIKLNKDQVTDTALVDGGTKTNDAFCNSWTWTVKDFAGLLTDTRYNDNYEIRLDTPVVAGKSHVEKANLTINLNDVIRQYGNVNNFLKDLALSQTADENGYKVTISTNDGEKLVNGDTFGEVDYTIDDKAIINVKGEDRTNNAGSYKWNISVTDEKLNNNYNIKVNEGNSYVKKAVLTLNDIIAKIEYGSKNGFEIHKGDLSGIAYDDDDVKLDVKDYEVISGSAYDANKGKDNPDRVTADVGEYADSIRVDGFVLSGADKDNYTFDESIGGTGSIEVTPTDLGLTLGEISRIYGDTWTDRYKYSIKDIVTVNGDNYSLDEVIKHLVLGNIVDNSLKDNNTKTQDVGDHYNWNYDNVSIKSGSDFDNGRLAKNYNATVKVTDGNAKVTKANLTINIGNVTTEYGKAFDEKDYNYTFGDVKGENVLVNGDTDQILKDLFNGNISYTNSADKTGEGNGKVTADAGKYDDAVNFTKDISNSLKNYNVTVNKGDAKVEQAELKVTLNDIIRNYGDITDKAYGVKGYDKLVNGDENLYADLLEKGFSIENIKDGTLTDDKQHTKDAGTDYKWTADVKANENYDNGRLNNNYKISVIEGTGEVKKVNLNININNAETEYGTAFDESKYGYTIESGWKNGDTADIIKDLLNKQDIKYSNKADIGGVDDKLTADKGTYTDAIDFANDLNNLLKNYNITTEKGDATVTAKKITINVDDKTTSTVEKPNYTGSKLEDLLVNGDKISSNDYHYGVQDPSIENQPNTYKDIIGIFINGLDFNNVPKDGFWNNYDITVNNGTLIVKDAIPEKDEHQMMRYDYLFDDNPFDHYRERKAEIHFIDGGMEI